MKARIRLTIIVIAVALIAFIAWLAMSNNGSLLGSEYPGFVNSQDLDIPEEVRAQWEISINTAEAQLKLDPDNLNAMMTIAFWENELGNHAIARRSIERMLEKNPINSVGWTMLGDIAYDMEDWDTAESSWAKSLELSTDENLFPKMENLWRLHKPERIPDIRVLYEDAIRLDKQRNFYMSRLSFWYEEQEMWTEAASHLKFVVQKNPDDEAVQEKYKELLKKSRNN